MGFPIPAPQPANPPPAQLLTVTDEMRRAVMDEQWRFAAKAARQAFARSLRARGYPMRVDDYTTR